MLLARIQSAAPLRSPRPRPHCNINGIGVNVDGIGINVDGIGVKVDPGGDPTVRLASSSSALQPWVQT
eukprot:135969-Prorocentrum_minimum.AAC.1